MLCRRLLLLCLLVSVAPAAVAAPASSLPPAAWLLTDAQDAMSDGGVVAALSEDVPWPEVVARDAASWQTVAVGRQTPVSPAGRGWVRVTLVNERDVTATWILYYGTFLYHTTLSFHVVHGGSSAESFLPLASRLQGTPLRLEPHETAQVYVAVDTHGTALPNHFAVVRAGRFSLVETKSGVPGLVYLGFVLFGAFLGLAAGLVLRDRSLLTFGGYGLSWFCFVFVLEGYWGVFVTSEPPLSPNRLAFLLAYLPAIWLTILWRRAPFAPLLPAWTRRTFRGLGVAIAALSVAQFIAARTLVPEEVLGALGLVANLLALGTALAAYRQRATLAGFYLVFSLLSLLDGGLLLVWLAGALPPWLSINVAVYVLQVLVFAVLTVAMARRVRAIEAERVRGETLREENDALRMLVQVVSHDLSSQIMGVSAIGYRLTKLVTTPEAQAQVERLQRLTAMQQDLVHKVRGLRALKDGKARLSLSPVPVTTIVDGLKDVFAEPFAAKGLALCLRIPPAGAQPLAVVADVTSLQHSVLGNVLSNALKFSHTGTVVHLQVEATDEYVRFTVDDEGIGIPVELRATLFDQREPTSRPGTSGEPGTGFGMPLAKAFLDAMGGRIWVEPREGGRGTRVTVELRRAP